MRVPAIRRHNSQHTRLHVKCGNIDLSIGRNRKEYAGLSGIISYPESDAPIGWWTPSLSPRRRYQPGSQKINPAARKNAWPEATTAEGSSSSHTSTAGSKTIHRLHTHSPYSLEWLPAPTRMEHTDELCRLTKKCASLFTAMADHPKLSDDDWLEDRAADFAWWSHGLKAQKTGRSSLDFRLRNRLDIQKVISGLLHSLFSALEEYLHSCK